MLKKYCLDANILIEAWHKYYSPSFCSGYWEVMNELGKQDRIFIPDEVNKEIIKTDDELSKWLKESAIPIRKTDEAVTKCLSAIYSSNPHHMRLVDDTKGRSLADPWVIAHAINEQAIVVTKENKITTETKKIKIPNVCENMGVKWINDFQLIRELNIHFTCILK